MSYEKVIEVLTEGHLRHRGGYPYAYEVHEGKVFVASLDPAKEYQRTTIEVYDEDELIEWERRAERFVKDNPDYDFEDAVYETAQ